jgi:hypothetical protein
MGRRRIVLHASDMGQPLYHSMGFEAGAKIPLFSPAWSSASESNCYQFAEK